MSNLLKLHFEDHGQDFLWWIVDTEAMRVVECGPHQHSVWVGVLLHEQNLTPGNYPMYYREVERLTRQLNHAIIKTEYCNPYYHEDK